MEAMAETEAWGDGGTRGALDSLAWCGLDGGNGGDGGHAGEGGGGGAAGGASFAVFVSGAAVGDPNYVVVDNVLTAGDGGAGGSGGAAAGSDGTSGVAGASAQVNW